MSEVIKNNHKMCIIAIENNPTSFQFMGEKIRNDYKMWVTRKTFKMLKYIPEKFRNRKSFIIDNAMGKRLCGNSEFIGEKLRDDKGFCLEHASERLRNDYDICIAISLHNPLSLKFIGNDIKNNIEFFREIIPSYHNSRSLIYNSDKNGELIRFADVSLKNNRELCIMVIEQNGGKDMKNDKDNPGSYQFIGDDFKNGPEKKFY
jgi:hypothetical protein